MSSYDRVNPHFHFDNRKNINKFLKPTTACLNKWLFRTVGNLYLFQEHSLPVASVLAVANFPVVASIPAIAAATLQLLASKL